MTAGRPVFGNLPAWPRLLRAEEAAAYLGMTRNSFDALVKQGVVHRPVHPLFGEKRRHGFWDRLRLDADVDRLFVPGDPLTGDPVPGDPVPGEPGPRDSGPHDSGKVDLAGAARPRLPTAADAVDAARHAHVRTPANGNRQRRRRHEGAGLALRHDAP